MGDTGDMYRDWREHKRATRRCKKCNKPIDATDCGLTICRDCPLTEAEQLEHGQRLELADVDRRRGWCREGK